MFLCWIAVALVLAAPCLAAGQQLSEEVTRKYLLYRNQSDATLSVPFLRRKEALCSASQMPGNVLSTSDQSLGESKKMFKLSLSGTNSTSPTVLVIYRLEKYGRYLEKMVRSMYNEMVETMIIPTTNTTVQAILCHTERHQPLVIFAPYSLFDLDVKRQEFSLGTFRYFPCSRTLKQRQKKKSSGGKDAVISPSSDPPHIVHKVIAVIDDPMMNIWFDFFTKFSVMPIGGEDQSFTDVMSRFNWTIWDEAFTRMLLDDGGRQLASLAVSMPTHVSDHVLNLPPKVLLKVESKCVMNDHTINFACFIDLVKFLRGHHFPYQQVFQRKELTPQASVVLANYSLCLMNSLHGVATMDDQMFQAIQQYVHAAMHFPPDRIKELSTMQTKEQTVKRIVHRLSRDPDSEDNAQSSSSALQLVPAPVQQSPVFWQWKQYTSSCQLRYKDRSYKQHRDDDIPVALVSGYDEMSVTLRLLLEHATGIFTGSLKTNKGVLGQLPGENLCSLQSVGVHATFFNFAAFWTPYDLELRLDGSATKKCRRGLVPKFVEAVVLLQDPYLLFYRRLQTLLEEMHTTVPTTTSGGINNVNISLATSLLQAFDDEMARDSVAAIFGDGAYPFLNHSQYRQLPMRSLFFISTERLWEAAYDVSRPQRGSGVFNQSSAAKRWTSKSNLTTESAASTFLRLLRFAHVPATVFQSPRLPCAFAFVEQQPLRTEEQVAEIQSMREFFVAHREVYCAVQKWLTQWLAPHHRRFHLLLSVASCDQSGQDGQVAAGKGESVKDRLAQCQERFAVRRYREHPDTIPAALIAPHDSFAVRVVREVVEHATGLFTGSLQSSATYQAVFPAEDFCGRRMGVIHAFPDSIGVSQIDARDDATFSVAILSKGSRSRCRRGVVTNFREAIVLVQDPFVFLFDLLFPTLMQSSATAIEAETATGGGDVEQTSLTPYDTVQRAFTADWSEFNRTIQTQREALLVNQLIQLTTTRYLVNTTSKHFLGHTTQKLREADNYAHMTPVRLFVGSAEAVLLSVQPLFEFSEPEEISIFVKEHRNAFFALLDVARLTSRTTVEQLQCAYAFAEPHLDNFQKRMAVIRRFYQTHPKVLCLARRWAAQIFAPRPSVAYLLFDVDGTMTGLSC